MNSSDFVPHRVNRCFINGKPKYDFVLILYRALTPTGRVSKYYHIYKYKYDHDVFAIKLDRVNESLYKAMKSRRPKLRKGYKWSKPKVMRVD